MLAPNVCAAGWASRRGRGLCSSSSSHACLVTTQPCIVLRHKSHNWLSPVRGRCASRFEKPSLSGRNRRGNAAPGTKKQNAFTNVAEFADMLRRFHVWKYAVAVRQGIRFCRQKATEPVFQTRPINFFFYTPTAQLENVFLKTWSCFKPLKYFPVSACSQLSLCYSRLQLDIVSSGFHYLTESGTLSVLLLPDSTEKCKL